MTKASAVQRKTRHTAAVNDLRTAVDRMITPTRSYLNNTYIEVPSLYRQLVDALDGRREIGRAHV